MDTEQNSRLRFASLTVELIAAIQKHNSRNDSEYLPSIDEELYSVCSRVEEKYKRNLREMFGEGDGVYIGGAKRSEVAPRYDLLVQDFLRGMAVTMGRGAESHGEYNYQLGDARYVIETGNHLEEHLRKYREFGDPQDLISIACNAMIIYWHSAVKSKGAQPKLTSTKNTPTTEA